MLVKAHLGAAGMTLHDQAHAGSLLAGCLQNDTQHLTCATALCLHAASMQGRRLPEENSLLPALPIWHKEEKHIRVSQWMQGHAAGAYRPL